MQTRHDNAPNSLEKSYSKKWSLIKPVLICIFPLGGICTFFGLAVMLGYALQLEFLYRPVAGGPATNPLTALCVLFLGAFLIANRRPYQSDKAQVFLFLVMGLTLLRLVDIAIGSSLSTHVTPFLSTVQQELTMGLSNAMGANTASMLLCLALAAFLSSQRQAMLSQIMSFIGLSLPILSFLGYAYQVDQFYGQMSLISAIFGLMLGLAILCLTPHRAIVKSVLSPYISGHTARIQLVICLSFPFLIGLAMVYSGLQMGKQFGLYVVIVSILGTILVCFSAVVQERVDYKRRIAERALSKVALYDTLTELPNRGMLYTLGQQELERSRRQHQPVWLLMLDVDYFKRINDTAGHELGDRVLQSLSLTLQNSVRSSDIIARLGGEEFVVMLSNINEQGAQKVAETIRKNVEAMEVADWTEDNGPITVSIGCASNSAYLTLSSLLAAADRAMYQAKEHGRNRVETESLSHQAPILGRVDLS